MLGLMKLIQYEKLSAWWEILIGNFEKKWQRYFSRARENLENGNIFYI